MKNTNYGPQNKRNLTSLDISSASASRLSKSATRNSRNSACRLSGSQLYSGRGLPTWLELGLARTSWLPVRACCDSQPQRKRIKTWDNPWRPMMCLHQIALTAIHPAQVQQDIRHGMAARSKHFALSVFQCWVVAKFVALLLFPTSVSHDAATPGKHWPQYSRSNNHRTVIFCSEQLSRPLHLRQLSFRGSPADLR